MKAVLTGLVLSVAQCLAAGAPTAMQRKVHITDNDRPRSIHVGPVTAPAAMQGKVHVTGYENRRVDIGPVTISLHDRREVQQFVDSKKKQMRAEMVRLNALTEKLFEQENYREAGKVVDKKHALSFSLFDDFDRGSALASSRTDAEGKFKLSAPDKKDLVLVAVADRKAGSQALPYGWILPREEWQEPMLLSNDNRFHPYLDEFPALLSGNLKKVRHHRQKNGVRRAHL